MLNVQQLHNMLQRFLLHVTYSYTLALLVTSCTADGVLWRCMMCWATGYIACCVSSGAKCEPHVLIVVICWIHITHYPTTWKCKCCGNSLLYMYRIVYKYCSACDDMVNKWRVHMLWARACFLSCCCECAFAQQFANDVLTCQQWYNTYYCRIGLVELICLTHESRTIHWNH